MLSATRGGHCLSRMQLPQFNKSLTVHRLQQFRNKRSFVISRLHVAEMGQKDEKAKGERVYVLGQYTGWLFNTENQRKGRLQFDNRLQLPWVHCKQKVHH